MNSVVRRKRTKVHSFAGNKEPGIALLLSLFHYSDTDYENQLFEKPHLDLKKAVVSSIWVNFAITL